MMTTALLDHEKFMKAMAGFTQEEFAEEIGITDRHVRNLKEKDTNISVSLLYRISQVFHIPMESLLIVREVDE